MVQSSQDSGSSSASASLGQYKIDSVPQSRRRKAPFRSMVTAPSQRDTEYPASYCRISPAFSTLPSSIPYCQGFPPAKQCAAGIFGQDSSGIASFFKCFSRHDNQVQAYRMLCVKMGNNLRTAVAGTADYRCMPVFCHNRGDAVSTGKNGNGCYVSQCNLFSKQRSQQQDDTKKAGRLQARFPLSQKHRQPKQSETTSYPEVGGTSRKNRKRQEGMPEIHVAQSVRYPFSQEVHSTGRAASGRKQDCPQKEGNGCALQHKRTGIHQ